MSNNPGATNVVNLWTLPSGAVPFSPNLTAAPRDFTVAITYNNIATPGSIAIDASGNAYVPTNATSGYVHRTLSPGCGARHQRHRRQRLRLRRHRSQRQRVRGRERLQCSL